MALLTCTAVVILTRCGSRRLHVAEEIAVRAHDHHVLIAREAVLISTQATDECLEVRIFTECISKQFGCFGIAFTTHDAALTLSFCQRSGHFIVGSRAQFFSFFLTL